MIEASPGGEPFEPDRLSPADFVELMAPLFERAPRFIGRLTAGRPYGAWEELFGRAVGLALGMPRNEQLELIDAHPRIGAPPGSVSAHSYVEQGYDREAAASEAEQERARVAAELGKLNGLYEDGFGFRFVVFVAGRARSEVVPLLAAALSADPEAERERALRDVVAIARDRALRSGLMPAGTAADTAADTAAAAGHPRGDATGQVSP